MIPARLAFRVSVSVCAAVMAVLPGVAAATVLPTAVLPADVDIRVSGNTIRAMIAVHGTAGPTNTGTIVCNGPWVHTEASANRILESPDIDLSTAPAEWMLYQPDSPNAAMTGTPTTTPNRLYLDSGRSGEAMIPAVSDGKYVAGVVCGQYQVVDGRYTPQYTSLKLYPLTVGTPDNPGQTPKPGNGGSLDILRFGSS